MARIVVEIPGERAYDVVVSAGQIDRLGAEMLSLIHIYM